LPIEKTFIDGVYANKKPQVGAPFYKVRKIAERLMKDLSVEVDFVKIAESDVDVPAPFDAKRSAWIVAKNGDNLGIVGELVSSARRNFKLPDYTAAFSIDIEKLQENLSKNQGYNYQPLSRFPSTARDISLKMDSNVDYAKVYACAEEVAKKHGELQISITPIAIYQPKNDDSTKTATLNVKFTSAERTLEDKDIAPIIEEIAAMAAEEFDAAQV
jgi:phenylalanyl-tRNA synthetase, beta subunit